MKFFLDFLHQKVPRAGKDIPLYYRQALTLSHGLLAVYFLVCFVLYPLIFRQWEWITLLFLAGAVLGMWAVRTRGSRFNLMLYAVLCVSWVDWNVHTFGWSCGVQHFLTLLLVFVFFNVYEKPLYKILWFLAILAIRILLFYISQRFPARIVMESGANTVYQTVNTVAFFTMLAGMCVAFSTSIQDTERQLRIRNQALYKEAGTDPLTGLPNRRAMIERIEQFCTNNPAETFCVAIADLDYFKKINDTYGHNCGDYTLVKLTELFTAQSGGRYSVCRWGGEEFCFFLPGKNLDEAGVIMNDLCFAVERMDLKFEDTEFSITITIGVEECDFSSPLPELLKAADEKLYMGKNAGRNRVVL